MRRAAQTGRRWFFPSSEEASRSPRSRKPEIQFGLPGSVANRWIRLESNRSPATSGAWRQSLHCRLFLSSRTHSRGFSVHAIARPAAQNISTKKYFVVFLSAPSPCNPYTRAPAVTVASEQDFRRLCRKKLSFCVPISTFVRVHATHAMCSVYDRGPCAGSDSK